MSGRRVGTLLAGVLIAACTPVVPPSASLGEPTASLAPATSSPLPGASATSPPSGPPTNGSIAFIRYVGGRPSVWLIEPDGANERLLVDGLLDGTRPANDCVSPMAFTQWSPDGNWLAFGVGGTLACNAELFIVRADGSELRPLGEATSVAWAPHGRELAVQRNMDDALQSEILFLALDGHAVRAAISGAGLSLGSPHYSPDGTHVLYSTSTVPEAQRRVVVRGLLEDEPTDICLGVPTGWSPDGSRILVERPEGSPDAGYDTGIYIVSPDSRDELMIGKGSVSSAESSWSPSGSFVAYFRHLVTPLADRVVVLATDFSGQIEIYGDTPAYGGTIAWAPDERRLAFSLYWGLGSEIYVSSPSEKGMRLLTAGEAPAWQPVFDQ